MVRLFRNTVGFLVVGPLLISCGGESFRSSQVVFETDENQIKDPAAKPTGDADVDDDDGGCQGSSCGTTTKVVCISFANKSNASQTDLKIQVEFERDVVVDGKRIVMDADQRLQIEWKRFNCNHTIRFADSEGSTSVESNSNPRTRQIQVHGPSELGLKVRPYSSCSSSCNPSNTTFDLSHARFSVQPSGCTF